MGEIIDKVQGKMKQVQGDVMDDPVKHAQGVAQEVKGKIEGKIEDIKHAAKDIKGHK